MYTFILCILYDGKLLFVPSETIQFFTLLARSVIPECIEENTLYMMICTVTIKCYNLVRMDKKTFFAHDVLQAYSDFCFQYKHCHTVSE